MRISLTDAGKRYNREWIFRHFTQEFSSGQRWAITGPNGSGKSTLLQVIAGATELSEGGMQVYAGTSHVESSIPVTGTTSPATADTSKNIKEQLYRHIALAAPYLELIEEMTALEFLSFHGGFKPFINNLSPVQVLDIIQLSHASNKQIRYYSSGMKQRLKLGQCILSDASFLLLDEPCTNLDQTGIDLYHQLIRDYAGERCVIVSSNDQVEFSFCDQVVDITRWKV